LPQENAKDIPELPERIREDLELICVSHLDEVLDIALLEGDAKPFTIEATDKEPDEGSKLTVPPGSSKNNGTDRPFQA
jgi:ATP-dependent Lon protease